jgi:signal transduction histidine kinase
VNLRLAQTLVARSWGRAEEVFADLRVAAADTMKTLTDLSRGFYPRTLTEAGLAPALRAAAAACPVPVTVSVDELRRESADLEAALYFCCLEALQNAAKHARASHVLVQVGRRDGALTLVVTDDGTGFAGDPPPTGTGLANMRDRIESAGGTLTVVSRPGRGTEITACVPVATSVGTDSGRGRVGEPRDQAPLDEAPLADAQASTRRSGPKADLAM